MAPEFGATAAMFYIDEQTIKYLKLTGRDDELVKLVETYAKQTGLWADSLKNARIRARAEVRSLDRGAHAGRPVESAPPLAGVGAGRARH